MKIQVLGGHGGLAQGALTTSYLIDDCLLLDAGAVAATTSVEQQKKIENILISHCHLDHIKDLAFICDNCFGARSKPFEVYSHETVHKMIKAHILNDIIWPDFSKLPTAEFPTIRFHSLASGEKRQIGSYQVTGVRVNHPLDAMGYLIEKDSSAVLFTQDTGPTDEIWTLAHKTKHLKAIFTEVSFPDKLQKVADLSHHHTSSSLKKELDKMPPDVPVILTHLKPAFRQLIKHELKNSMPPRVQVLDHDGECFHF